MSVNTNTVEEIQPLKKTYKTYFLIIALIYLILVVAGVHTSSVTVLGGERISETVTFHGKPQSIRSDEYLRSTPILLGQIKSSADSSQIRKRTTTTPFDSSYPDKSLSGDLETSQGLTLDFHSIYSGVLRFDDRLLALLPLNQQFVAQWWLNSFYLFIGLGLFFRALKKSWKYALLCSLLVWLSPPNQWWSLWPVQSIGPASVAAGLFLGSILFMDEQVTGGRRSNRSVYFGVLVPLFVSAIFAIRLPATYQPWSIPTSIFFACVTFGALWKSHIAFQTIKKLIIPFLVFFAVGAIPVILTLSRSITKAMSTVYPGSRRFTGFTDFPHWSGPASWGFQFVSGNTVNQSEFAVGLLIFIPVTVLAFILRPINKIEKGRSWYPVSFAIAPMTIFLFWVIAPWSKGMSEFLLMSRFPPERMMQILGVLSPILFVLAVGFWREQIEERDFKKNSPLIISCVVFILTLQGAISLKIKLLSNLSVGSIWATATLMALIMFTTFTKKFWQVGLTLLVVASLFSVAQVNPIVRGVGIFGKSAAMEALDSAQALNPGRWASDNYIFDSVPTGGGMRLLSGNQGSGPNLEAYRLLDPDNEFIEFWNRAGSYVFFNWTSGPEIGFVNPSFDVVGIQIDPCNAVLNQFDLAWVVSSNDLSSHTCLRYYGNIIFQGNKFNVFLRT
jgi:hypothetical protein